MSSFDDVRSAYDASAAAWAAGPDGIYGHLARALLRHAPTEVAGAKILDLGSGTGTAARAAHACGARWVVGLDLAEAMLRRGTGPDSSVCADVAALPFARGAFDLAVAACCLGHLPEPGRGLSEARRVAGGVVASAFLKGWTHPAKSIVDAAAAARGFVAPGWYVALKTGTEPVVDDPASLEMLARAAGFQDVRVQVEQVDVGLRSPTDLVRWRLGMAHLAPWVAAQDDRRMTDLIRMCKAELQACPPVVVPQVWLSAC